MYTLANDPVNDVEEQYEQRVHVRNFNAYLAGHGVNGYVIQGKDSAGQHFKVVLSGKQMLELATMLEYIVKESE